MWRKKLMNSFFAVVLSACFGQSAACAMSAPHPEKFVIVKGGAPQATIIVSRGASGDEMSAANELQSYIRKVSGVLIPIKRDNKEFPGNIIAIGRNKVNVNSDLGLDKLEKEGFRIKTNGNILSLAGKDDTGTQFAVYSFLEKYLGIKWFWPGELGEAVPKMQTIEVGPIDDTEEPDFKWRNRGPEGALWGAPTGPTEMHARELLLGVTREHQKEVELWEKRNKWGGMKIYGGHCLGEIFPPEKYGKTHPEYYALINGKRDVPGPDYDYKHEGQICTTNPEVIKVIVEWIRNFFDKHPDYDGVHITLNDGSGFCECERCRALDVSKFVKGKGIDAEETQRRRARRTVITDRVFTYVNQVAEEVQKSHPGKYVVSMAYSRYITPPKRIKLHPFVVPQYCLWSAYKHSNAEQKKTHEKIAAGWAKASKKTGIYEYYINGSWPGLHRLTVPYFAKSIKYLYKQGIDLYQLQSGDEFGINGINYYVAGKLLWDTSLDEKKILDDFYQKAFGRGGESVRRFHNRLEEAWRNATIESQVSCYSLKDTRLPELFNPQLLKQCYEDLAEAERLADNDLMRRRVEFYRKGLHYAELTVDAVRASKKVIEAAKAAKKSRALDVNLFLSDKTSREKSKKLVAEALAAWEKRDKFVEGLKNDYVLSYFWVRYNNYTRTRFYPVGDLKKLAKILN